MARLPNTKADGSEFPRATIDAVWQKATQDPQYSSFRKDACGASIMRYRYGRMQEYGWEIDHIKPVLKGGSDDLGNLQPLQWENNRRKGDDWPDWSCAVKS